MLSSPIVVVGASLGGVDAFQRLAAGLPAAFVAPLLVVLHVGAHKSILPRLIASSGQRPALHPVDGEVIQQGHIYVAPPDHHMLVEGPVIRLTKGPKEHHTRPAVDPLFRSAALSRGADVIGLVMTGALNDGTAGLQAIKACGGQTVVQDPNDALEPSMPASALAWAEIDHSAPLERIPQLLASLANASGPQVAHVPDQTVRNVQDWFLGKGNIMDTMQDIATPSTYVCPDCKGALWELDGTRPTQLRCHTGHAFTLQTLYATQTAQTDEALWNAVRALQEQEFLLDGLIQESDGTGHATETLQSLKALARSRTEALRALVTAS